jgi:hypothetical protein
MVKPDQLGHGIAMEAARKLPKKRSRKTLEEAGLTHASSPDVTGPLDIP